VSQLILVVDDDPSVRASTVRLLAVRGYAIFEAATAAEALDIAKALRPHAILLDLLMHGTTGVEAARHLKADNDLKNIPIIALSATPPATDVSSLFVAVLSKPCPSDEIVRTIEAAMSS
jgi:CheY-like chemotaxis protein